MNLFSPPPRNLRAELLDLDEAPFEEVRESLNDVRRVNRYLGGYKLLLHYVFDFFKKYPDKCPFTILDTATGSADQPVAVVKLARKLRIPVRITAVDINRKMLNFASEESDRFPEIKFVQCDILSLPFFPESFDLVINSLSLHHFSRENAISIIRAMNMQGRCGFIVNDLHRSRVAFGSIVFLTRLFTSNRLTRYDAPVSVMNAFTPQEMEEMAQEAGVENFRVHRHFPYRIALVGKK